MHIRDKWKLEGKCVQCGNKNERIPATLCQSCRELQAIRTKNYMDRIKIETFNAYGGCFCKCCGESNIIFLALDHIGGGGSEHRRMLRGGKGDSGGGGNKTYHWLKKNGYPSGYRVLCANCNHAYHVLGECPHNKEIEVDVDLLANTAFRLLKRYEISVIQ